MLISPRQLLDRLRYPRSRADELSALRARFHAAPTRREASSERVASAERLRALRSAISAATAAPEACRSCAEGHPEPAGHWPGGHCCSGRTLEIWSRDECAALKLAGVDVGRLEPPAGDHAGCVFRGARGCSIAPGDRPSLCLRYVCGDLRVELKRTGAWPELSRLLAELVAEEKRQAAFAEAEDAQA